MQFSTPVGLPPCPFSLTPGDRVVVVGSCFAEHIGRFVSDLLPSDHVAVNPFGVLYHPTVMAAALRSLMAHSDLEVDNIFWGSDGLWHSWMHSGVFSRSQREECERAVAAALQHGREVLKEAVLLILTPGTTHHYCLNDGTGRIVANCHKEAAECFTEGIDTVATLLPEWQELTQQLRCCYPRLNIVWTVSPYRYLKYGAHASQLSKANLLLLIDALCEYDCGEGEHTARTSYFPAYEILLDELRDYRFYAADMVHPSDVAVAHIGECFTRWCFSPAMHDYANEVRKLRRDLSHRPLHPESEAYCVFREQLSKRLRLLGEKWGISPFK